MYARLRQKITINDWTTTNVTSNGTGTLAFSVLIKDIARVITGQVTSISGLNSAVWDTANSEIVGTVSGGWTEYQSTFTTTATNMGAGSVIYLRSPSSNTPSTFKYVGLGIYAGVPNAGRSGWNILHPWGVTDYTGNPSLSFSVSGRNSDASSRTRNPIPSIGMFEFVIYSSPRALVVVASQIGANAPFKVCCALEYPSTPLSSPFNLPNQVFWEISSYIGGVESAGGLNTNTSGAGTAYITTGYQVPGGYLPSSVPGASGDIPESGVNNMNYAFTYTRYGSSLAFTSLWGTGAELSTLKPSSFANMSGMIDTSGAAVSVPALPLLHFPPWDSCYDLSSLTGVYGTRSGLGATGDTLTVNGQPYAYINAPTMGYLLPRQ